MVDGLETAAAWGLHLDYATPSAPPLIAQPLDGDAEQIASTVVEQWLPVSQFINAMDRSLGAHDSYPFIVVAPVVAKLDFIHRVVQAARRGAVPMNFQAANDGQAPQAVQEVQEVQVQEAQAPAPLPQSGGPG